MRRLTPLLVLAVTLLLMVPSDTVAPADGDFDPQEIGEVWRYEHGAENGTLWSVCWSPDGEFVAAAFFNNDVVVLNGTTGELLHTLSAMSDEARCDGYAPPGHVPTRAVAWSPDGQHLAAAGDDTVVYIWDTSDWSLWRSLTGHEGSVQSLAWSHAGDRLASGSGRDKVVPNGPGENKTFIWDPATATVLARLEGHRDSVLGMEWSPDDSRIATASDDRTARIWDPETGDELTILEGHTSGVLDCVWSPDGSLMVTGSRDYKARRWDLNTGESDRWSDNNCIRSVDWHPGGAIVATSGVDKTLKFRNSTTGSVLVTIDDGIDLGSVVMQSRFDPQGVHLVAAYGKAATVIMYGPEGAVPPEGEDTTAIISGTIIVIIAVVGTVVLLYPAYRKARRRRG
ncbi:MAG: WD40 repeat domain-containing protein [Thermoplasmata archaeon]|nr:MAG: WD40 repeat domain-containing protein [Thermoplasmata archaeon]